MSVNPTRRKDNFLVFGAPRIGEDEINEVVANMRSGWLGTGPKVSRFEKDFSNYNNSPYTAAVNSCTATLHLSMLAARLEPGDEVPRGLLIAWHLSAKNTGFLVKLAFFMSASQRTF